MISITDNLNREQKEAVEYTEGPLLILAGAGSGKTRVLTHRVGYLLSRGVMPWNILAITFTNKAAGEMRERVDKLISQFEEEGLVTNMHGSASDVFVSTFHSMCVRLLRRDIDKLGYERDFTIYDADDQKTLIRNIIKSLDFDSKMYRERGIAAIISSAKNNMIDAEEYRNNATDFYERNVADIYAEYEKRMKSNNALDFDDLLLKTVEMFNRCPDVLSFWQERFRYIMVDEYQDTNNVQFEIVRLLSDKHKNLCVVGDDDQSIYKFRGANIENILSFEHTFPDTKVIKLEQNYRSTGNILEAANFVIKNNKERKEKHLWTNKEEGERPVYNEYDTAASEADMIIKEAYETSLGMQGEPVSLKDQAVLYRTNAQSRLLEERCIKYNVPYIIVGGVNFYQRKEIKDILSYLRIISNSVDDLAIRRIINVPKRGIGSTTEERIAMYSDVNSLSFYDSCKRAAEIPGVSASSKKIDIFISFIETERDKMKLGIFDLQGLIRSIVEDTGYKDELFKEGDIEAQTRLENIEELINKAVAFSESYDASENQNGLNILSAFLEEVSLVADIDRTNDTDDVLTMMTLHSAKGLEFDKVYLSGMEEGLFPSSVSINSDDPEAEIEEERRLCYVGITRAKKILRLSSAKERMVNGELRLSKPSRFVDELPDKNVVKHFRRRMNTWENYDDDYDNPIPKRGFISSSSFASVYGGFGSLDKTPGGKSKINTGNSLSSFGAVKGAVKEKPDYNVGDTVSHIKFGKGIVNDIKEGERDYEVSVDFENFGIKKMFAGFAKLKKL